MFLSGLKYLRRLERQVKFAKNRCCKIKPVAVLTDRPDMTLDVYRGRKTTIQPTSDACKKQGLYRTLDKTEYLVVIRDSFSQFCTKIYVVTPHLICLDETVQMRGHNIFFQ